MASVPADIHVRTHAVLHVLLLCTCIFPVRTGGRIACREDDDVIRSMGCTRADWACADIVLRIPHSPSSSDTDLTLVHSVEKRLGHSKAHGFFFRSETSKVKGFSLVNFFPPSINCYIDAKHSGGF
ncbi:hypothetical protein NPIL_331541 [Nephila pilipes]|uniref:Uncharacterized protein n=1 Tax=Nephila pilipes TaxID=299642 RepID=A0A8X6TXP6_NEPPI|nr:hypothetical protein NPIL_331541 [Nephila pilipes]